MGAQHLLPQLIPQCIGFSHLRDLCQFVHQLVHQLFERGLEIAVLFFTGGVGEPFRELLQQRAKLPIFHRAGLHPPDEFFQCVPCSRSQFVSTMGLFPIDGGQLLPEYLTR